MIVAKASWNIDMFCYMDDLKNKKLWSVYNKVNKGKVLTMDSV